MGVADNRIEIKVFPGSSREEIVCKDGIFKVYVQAAPDKGKANKAVIKLLSKEYGVKKRDICIIKGEKSRKKVVEIKV